MSTSNLLFHFFITNFHKILMKELINPDIPEIPGFSFLFLFSLLREKKTAPLQQKRASPFPETLLLHYTKYNKPFLNPALLFRFVNPGNFHLVPLPDSAVL